MKMICITATISFKRSRITATLVGSNLLFVGNCDIQRFDFPEKSTFVDTKLLGCL